MDHPVEGVQGGGDGELPQALPPGVGHLGERRRIRALCFGRRRSQGCALELRGPVAFAGLQELPRSGVWLEETKYVSEDMPGTAQCSLFPLFSCLSAELRADLR